MPGTEVLTTTLQSSYCSPSHVNGKEAEIMGQSTITRDWRLLSSILDSGSCEETVGFQ